MGGRPPEDEATWACAACTFVNRPLALACSVCGRERSTEPPPKVEAADAQPPPTKKPRGSLAAASGSLAAFFGGVDKRPPPFFHLAWDGGVGEPEGTFSPRRPEGATVVGEVNWKRGGRPVVLCWSWHGGGGDPGAASPAPQPQSPFGKGHLQLLKSHLQKCVRRGLASKAVATASAMVGVPEGWEELLQRLGIVVIEDATAFQGCEALELYPTAPWPWLSAEVRRYPALVWLMASAYKGFGARVGMVDWVCVAPWLARGRRAFLTQPQARRRQSRGGAADPRPMLAAWRARSAVQALKDHGGSV